MIDRAHLEARVAVLEEFVASVVFGYLEMHEPYHQCPWCLWVPDRDWDPVHDCGAKTLADDPAIEAAWERCKEEETIGG